MAKISKKEKNIELYKAILALKNLDECCRFFEDLCTVPELRAMEQRYDQPCEPFAELWRRRL